MLTGVHANGPVENGVTTSAHDSCLMITDENLLDYTTAHIDIEGGEEAWFTKLQNLNPRSRGYLLGGKYVVSNPADVALVLPKGPVPKGATLSNPTPRSHATVAAACFFVTGVTAAVTETNSIQSVSSAPEIIDGEHVATNTADGENKARKVMEAQRKAYQRAGCVVTTGILSYSKSKRRWVWTFEVFC